VLQLQLTTNYQIVVQHSVSYVELVFRIDVDTLQPIRAAILSVLMIDICLSMLKYLVRLLFIHILQDLLFLPVIRQSADKISWMIINITRNNRMNVFID
jgi:hypothetical protein